jgi:hypothetical protein
MIHAYMHEYMFERTHVCMYVLRKQCHVPWGGGIVLTTIRVDEGVNISKSEI